MPTRGRRQEQTAQSKARIHAAAVSLFSRRGFEAVSMEEVAQKARVSRRTLYRHFRDKRDLLFPFAQERLHLLVEGLRAHRRKHREADFLEALSAGLMEVAARLSDRPLEASSDRLVDSAPELVARRAALFGSLQEPLLAELQLSPLWRDRTLLSQQIAVAAVVAALQTAMNHWTQGPAHPSAPDAASEMIRTLTPLFRSAAPKPPPPPSAKGKKHGPPPPARPRSRRP